MKNIGIWMDREKAHIIQDSKYLEREKHQFKKYFKTITSYIKNGDNIVIYGPAEAGEKLHKELKENYKEISKKITDVMKADSMTENQTKALIRDYFKNYKPSLV